MSLQNRRIEWCPCRTFGGGVEVSSCESYWINDDGSLFDKDTGITHETDSISAAEDLAEELLEREVIYD